MEDKGFLDTDTPYTGFLLEIDEDGKYKAPQLLRTTTGDGVVSGREKYLSQTFLEEQCRKVSYCSLEARSLIS